MAPKVAPKPSKGEAKENPASNREGVVKKKPGRPGGKKRSETYASYAYKVLRNTHKDVGISSKAMGLINSQIDGWFNVFAKAAAQCAIRNRKGTLTEKEMLTAASMLLPPELAKHVVEQAKEHLEKYSSP